MFTLTQKTTSSAYLLAYESCHIDKRRQYANAWHQEHLGQGAIPDQLVWRHDVKRARELDKRPFQRALSWKQPL